MNVEFISQPFATRRLGDYLLDALGDARWQRFLASVAFAKRSGTAHVLAPLHAFAGRATTRISVGVDHGGTSLEGVEDLFGALDGRGELFVAHHTRSPGDRVHHTFHPKVFLFDNSTEALALVGSGNLTQGGLFGNYEAGVALRLDLGDSAQRAFHRSIVQALDDWADPASPLCTRVDSASLIRLYDEGYLPREATIRPRSSTGGAGARGSGIGGPTLFPPAPVPAPPPTPSTAPVFTRPVSSTLPPPPRPAPRTRTARAPGASPPSPSRAAHRVLYIEVIPHHNGEIFLSKLAIRDDPAFFGHPFSGRTTPKRAGNAGYPMRTPDPIVDIVVYDDTDAVLRRAPSHSLNMVEYERKGEIRITVPDRMQDVIPEMALLVMAIADPATGREYTLDFYPPGSPSYGTYASNLVRSMPSGGRPGPGRRYGWG